MSSIAVTGTKGKTTILRLINDCLVENSHDVACVYTEGITHNSDIITEQRKISNYADVKYIAAEHYLIEATSYMLSKGNFDSSNFDAVILNDIEPYEHAEIHRNFVAYFHAKKRILRLRKEGAPAFVNRDSEYYDKFVDQMDGPIISYGVSEDASCNVRVDEINADKMHLTLRYKDRSYSLDTSLLGEYNAVNIAAAFACLVEMGVDPENVCESLQRFQGVEGRMERYSLSGNRVVAVDYAHTPNSLAKVIDLLKQLYPEKKMITLFGCGGNKSKYKRPRMGAIASDKSDKVYVTNDNPRKENPMNIFEHIISGMSNRNYVTEPVRKRAILKAVKENPDSVILLAGKGAEKYTIDLRGQTKPGSDADMLHGVCVELDLTMEKIQ